MPPLKTYNDEKNTYSVDMMMAYVNTHKVPIQRINIEENLWQIEQPVWGDYSPSDVLRNPSKKKYAENMRQRMKESGISGNLKIWDLHSTAIL